MRGLPIILGILLFSCKSEPKSTKELEEIAKLEAQVEQLKMEASQNDSMLNESLNFFNDVQSNLAAIKLKEDELKNYSSNGENPANNKDLMIQKIKEINNLRLENKQKISNLEAQLKGSNQQLSSLQKMIENLKVEIAARDEQILAFQEQISRKDQDYAVLFDTYQAKENALTESENERYTTYFVYGTEDELERNGVINKKNGIIGIGKKVTMKDNLNYRYFTKADQRTKKEFIVIGRKPKIISSHPTDSYEMKVEDNKATILILSSEKFWKNSSFLIVTVSK